MLRYAPAWRCFLRPRCGYLPTRAIRQYSAPATVGKNLNPLLLQRAREISQEHKGLSQQLADAYDSQTAKRAGELAVVTAALEAWDRAKASLDELETLLQDSSTDEELRVLAQQDLESSAQSLRDAAASLTSSLVPKDPYAHLPCMVEIRPGVGGREAAIFAGDLLRMYTAYCTNSRLRMQLLQRDSGDTPEEVVEAVFEVDSAGAYGLLRCEAGVHRVQRVPATEAKGRLHTSTAAVMILPRAPQDDADAAEMAVDDPASDFYIDPKEVERQYLRASGAGGQHVNKTESKVRLTHTPTGTTVAIQESRSRADNEKRAWALLRAKLALMRRERREAETTALRRSVIGVARTGRADKVRTYNWQQQRVTDHRCGVTVHGIDGIMEGGVNLLKLMDAVRKWQAEVDIENLIADAKVTAKSG